MDININKIKKNQYKFFFVLPAFIFVLVIFIIPSILNFGYSFTNWSPVNPDLVFRGLANFIELSQQKIIWSGLSTSIKFAVSVCILQNLTALLFAIAIEKATKFNAVARTILFIPVVLSPLAAGYIWRALYHYQGPINGLLSFITRTDVNFPFLGNLNLAIFFIAITQSWKAYGITMLVYIAGLKSIPEELIEAARVEGGSNWSILMRIKLPLLGPSFTFNLVTTLIGSLSAFELILVMTRGGPGRATEVLNLLIYEYFGYGRWGYATAVTFVNFIFISIIAIPLIYWLRKREVEL
jgi:raffinose/stachyose/melibiose transport system permease protein